ncbi:MAG: adenosylcobinamide-phosphate synthase CbiB [Deltaproteobacteria bacterium]|jgi:adenosylcobinamide-phosphate synthase|nr:adenosylcobinamide-phosphate synthase CbiB [Deltaproteobacteria bacterium]
MAYFLSVNYLLFIPLAIALDFLLGDPLSWPHPVKLIGRMLDGLEKFLLSALTFQKTAGVVCVLAAALAAGGSVFALLDCARGVAYAVLAVYLAYAALALGCLLREGRRANALISAVDARRFSSPELEAARKAVSLLVSRDVSRLQKPALYRTLAETLSENFNDAFIAPLFWLLLGGQTGVWVYKCVSTADSRWGYRHDPWSRRGWAAARLDDFLAFIPARLSAVLLYMASSAEGRKAWPSWAALRRDAARMESPNAGWSMAAAAWLHGAGMGGPAVYAGKIKEKPCLGPHITGESAWNEDKIAGLLAHLRKAGLLGAALLWAAPLAAVGLARGFRALLAG